MSKKRILVTGGAGFLGSALCEKLLSNNNQVICLDNLFTGNKVNVARLADNYNFSFVNADITLPLEIPGQLDEIYNFACPASPPKYQADPIYSMKTSVFGMINLLDLAVERTQRSSRHRHRKFTAIHWCILRMRSTVAMFQPSEFELATTKESVVLKP